MVRPATQRFSIQRNVDASNGANRVGSIFRRVESCSPGSFDDCVKKSTFSLGVSKSGNMSRVRVLLRKRELSASQLHEAHASILNAYMASKESPTYEWELKTDPVSELIDYTQSESPILTV